MCIMQHVYCSILWERIYIFIFVLFKVRMLLHLTLVVQSYWIPGHFTVLDVLDEDCLIPIWNDLQFEYLQFLIYTLRLLTKDRRNTRHLLHDIVQVVSKPLYIWGGACFFFFFPNMPPGKDFTLLFVFSCIHWA